MNVFVYGSLLRGFVNNRCLTDHGAVFVREAKTLPHWKMISLGAFPAIVPGGITAIVGEVWDVTSEGLAALDHLESEGRFYHRRYISLEGGTDALGYSLIDRRDNVEVVTSGDWRAFVAARDKIWAASRAAIADSDRDGEVS